nr:hypothetical protein [Neosynechococcus sphagnicola]
MLVPQITFAGAILPLRDVGAVGQTISQLTVTRWAFESMVTITGMGRDIAHDPCWQKTEAQRKALTEAQKQSCQCLGANLFRQCNFPGVRDKYDPVVDQPEPKKPAEPGDPPPQPDNPFNTTYRDDLKTYTNKVNAYQTAIQTWQQTFSTWKEKRGTAIASAEALISRFQRNQGAAFNVNVLGHWGKLGLLIGGMLGLLLLVQARKDIH